MYGLGTTAAAVLALVVAGSPARGDEAADTALAPERAIEVEAMVPIVDGDAATARQHALDRVFGDIVTIAAEAHTGVGTLEQRPAVARRLRRDATDFLLGYQIVTDTYRLAADDAQGEPEHDAMEALAEPAPALPPNHYLVRVRGWVDEGRLRSALGMADGGGAADLAVVVRAVSSGTDGAGDGRLARLREAVVAQLEGAGWRVAGDPDAVARRALHLDADWVAGTGRVEVRLTGRVTATDGTLVAVLQASGESHIGNQYFAWADAERGAATDLGNKLSAVSPPSGRGAREAQSGQWVDVTIAPLSGYQWGLELEEAIREQVPGIGAINRGGYAEGRFRLQLLFRDPLDTLPARLETVRWRDFTLRVVARSPTTLEVRVQRF
ncbi:MAG: hypothetical protein PVF51_12240 [Nitrospirota bacterium]|jgi:hypothetical protein